jgi:hypothetical protein
VKRVPHLAGLACEPRPGAPAASGASGHGPADGAVFSRFTSSRFNLILAILAIAAALVLYLCTPWGLAVSFDSFAYLHVAENVLAGRGFVLISTDGYRPMTHWPPLYPAALAVASRLGFGLMGGARLLQAALFASNLILAAILVNRATRRWGPAIATAAFLACSADMLTIHTAAWSEPLFLLLAVGGMWALAASVEPSSPEQSTSAGLNVRLAIAGALIGLACVTRYSGVSVAIAGLAYLLLHRRFRATTLFLAIAMTPLAVWLARNHALAGAGTDRHLAWHPIGRGHLRFALSTALFWLAPRAMPVFARGAMLVLIGAAAALLVKYRKTAAHPTIPAIHRLLALFIATYLVFVLLARTFVDAAIPMDARIFSPVLYTGTIAVAIVTARSIRLATPAWAALLAMLLIPHAVLSARFLRDMRRDGAGYSSRAWQTSPLVAYVRELPPGTRVYSNGMVPIAFLNGRWVRGVPEPSDRLTARADPAYAANIAVMEADLHRGALLVDFQTLEPRQGGQDLPDLALRLDLSPIHRTPDGTVYAARSASAVP